MVRSTPLLSFSSKSDRDLRNQLKKFVDFSHKVNQTPDTTPIPYYTPISVVCFCRVSKKLTAKIFRYRSIIDFHGVSEIFNFNFRQKIIYELS